jgi:hypothetical protein
MPHPSLAGKRVLITHADVFMGPVLCEVFAAYLCGEAANCCVGQVFPVCGGWVNR